MWSHCKWTVGAKPQEHAPGDFVICRVHRNVLGHRMRVAQAAFQKVVGIDGAAASGRVHQVDRLHRCLDGVRTASLSSARYVIPISRPACTAAQASATESYKKTRPE